MTEGIDPRTEAEKKKASNIIIRTIITEDLDDVQAILGQWTIGDNGEVIVAEVDSYIDRMRRFIAEGTENFFVAVDDSDKVIGIMGMNRPDEVMTSFAQTENPIELINAFVSKESTGKGIGRKLITKVEQAAWDQGQTEIVLGSGPRYRESGWGFYDSLPGYERIGVAKDYYGEGRDAMVWHKVIKSEEVIDE